MSDSEDSSPSNFVDQHFYPTAITAALPPIVTIADHGLTNGQALRATKFVYGPITIVDDVEVDWNTGMQQLNNRLFYVQQATTNTFGLYDANSVPIDGRNFTPFINNGLAQFTRTGPTLPIVNPAPEPPSGVPPFPPV